MVRLAGMAIGAWFLFLGLVSPPAVFPQWIAGLVILVVEAVALRFDALRWVSFAVGLVLVAAPFVFDYGSAALAFNSYAGGLTLAVLASQPRHRATYSLPSAYNQEIYRDQGEGRAYR